MARALGMTNPLGKWASWLGTISLGITSVVMVAFAYLRDTQGLSADEMARYVILALIWIIIHIVLQIFQAVTRRSGVGSTGLLDQYLSLIPLIIYVVLMTRWYDGMINLQTYEFLILSVYGLIALIDVGLERIISLLLARRTMSMGTDVGEST